MIALLRYSVCIVKYWKWFQSLKSLFIMESSSSHAAKILFHNNLPNSVSLRNKIKSKFKFSLHQNLLWKMWCYKCSQTSSSKPKPMGRLQYDKMFDHICWILDKGHFQETICNISSSFWYSCPLCVLKSHVKKNLAGSLLKECLIAFLLQQNVLSTEKLCRATAIFL